MRALVVCILSCICAQGEKGRTSHTGEDGNQYKYNKSKKYKTSCYDSTSTCSFSLPFLDGGGPKRLGELAIATDPNEANLLGFV